jgi:hypothetical protein
VKGTHTKGIEMNNAEKRTKRQKRDPKRKGSNRERRTHTDRVTEVTHQKKKRRDRLEMQKNKRYEHFPRKTRMIKRLSNSTQTTEMTEYEGEGKSHQPSSAAHLEAFSGRLIAGTAETKRRQARHTSGLSASLTPATHLHITYRERFIT